MPLVLDGLLVGEFGFSSGYTTTTTESNGFFVQVTIPSDPVEQYFTIACTGGSPTGGTGIVVHVWQDSS